MNKKMKSSYDELIEKLSPRELEEFERDYENLLIPELILAAMHKDGITVRRLAKEAGVSPTIIQGIRSGTRRISAASLIKIFNGLGYTLQAQRDGEVIALSTKNNR